MCIVVADELDGAVRAVTIDIEVAEADVVAREDEQAVGGGAIERERDVFLAAENGVADVLRHRIERLALDKDVLGVVAVLIYLRREVVVGRYLHPVV